MPNVLVTGGAGYIGSHCCKELSVQGFNPIIIDNLIYGYRENVKWGEFLYGDIGDIDLLNKCFQENEITAVIHFAAFAYVGESVTDPMKYYENNVRSTINLLQSMIKNNIQFIIFSSSCSTYGVPENIPIEETHSQNPINPYGRTKYIIEQMLKDYARAYDLKFLSLRYFNAAGADPEGEIGENHVPETHLIPLVLDVALGKRETIHVFGTDYPTHDGTCIRDYIHVTDLSKAHIAALKYLLNGGRSGVYNLGNGSGYSVLEVIKTVEKVTGRQIPVINAPRRNGDPPILIASNKKASKELAWAPEIPELDEIVRTAWEWHKKIK